MFFTDVMNHLQALNLSLQGKDKMVSYLFQIIFSFHNKMKLFQRDINTNLYNTSLCLKDLSLVKMISVQKRYKCVLRACRVLQIILQQGFQI